MTENTSNAVDSILKNAKSSMAAPVYRLQRSQTECKTKRLQLTVTPSIYQLIAAIAAQKHWSINETCSQLFVAGAEAINN